MLDLDSPVWASVPASCDMTSVLTVELLRQVWTGDDTAYAELYNQVCHQFTVGAIAYLAVPHLVEVARERPLKRRIWPLSIVGTVAAARVAYSQSAADLREEWRTEYEAANDAATKLAAEALNHTGWEASESQELLATLAALHGHSNLAIHLFMSGGDTRLSCPACGEYIEFGENADQS
jgi:hypothetical protein